MKRRYSVVVAAMILVLPLGDTASAADPTLEQLETIQDMLEGNDVRELRQYIDAHPELLEGEAPLAQLLVRFMRESTNMTRFLGLDAPREDDGPDAPLSDSIY